MVLQPRFMNSKAQHGLHVPVLAHEFGGQPIQQFRIGGRVAHFAEVIDRADDATAKMIGPDAIDFHPSGQRILRRHQPFSQCTTPSRCMPVRRRNFGGRIAVGGDGNEAGLHENALGVGVAPQQEVGRRHVVLGIAFAHERSGGGIGDAALGTSDGLIAAAVGRGAIVAVSRDLSHRDGLGPLFFELGDLVAQNFLARRFFGRHVLVDGQWIEEEGVGDLGD